VTSVSSILIIGAGQAAAVAATTLRKLGFSGTLTIVGNEPHAPYERPPLSKDALACGDDQEPPIHLREPAYFSENGIDLRLGCEVTALDPERRRATLADGSMLEYDRCLIATGGQARPLPGLEGTFPSLHYLRTLDDARALRSSLRSTPRLIVLGGGFLGLEIASTASRQGVQVTVAEAAPRLLARAVPEEFSDWLQDRVAQAGVTLHLGQAVTRVDLPAAGQGCATVALSDGQVLKAELLVAAIGMEPATRLARDAGLRLDANGGIAVDEACRSSDPHIYAAGDCASQRRAGQADAMRLESWQNANEQARIAAGAMLGQASEPPAYPWFWTDQFDCNIQMLGLPAPGLTYHVRANATSSDAPPRLLMLGVRDGRACHAIAVNAGGDLRALRPVLERNLPIDVNRFLDDNISLRELAKSTLAAMPAQR